jgi:hypothetical protein
MMASIEIPAGGKIGIVGRFVACLIALNTTHATWCFSDSMRLPMRGKIVHKQWPVMLSTALLMI